MSYDSPCKSEMIIKNEVKKLKQITKRLIGIICVLSVFAVFISGCERKSQLTKYEAQFLDLFDTVTTIVGYEESEEDFKQKVEQLQKELETYHELYDIYDTYKGINNIKTINDNAGIKPVKVDKRIIELLERAIELYDSTDGKVNIAYGSVLAIWHDYRTNGINSPEHAKLPTMNELNQASKHTDIKKVKIDKEKATVYLEDKKMSLDVGAIGKGYAVERVGNYAKQIGMKKALISVGGNICAIGTRDDETSWRVGLQNPDMDSQQAYVLKVKLEDKSFVTSGNYQRYYVVNGKKYHHIINPDTKMPANYCASVSVLSSYSGTADALSTALYNMPVEKGKVMIEKMEDTEAVWIKNDGTIEYSAGFQDYITE